MANKTGTKPNETAVNGAKPDESKPDEKERDCTFPFASDVIHTWIAEGMEKDYGTKATVSDFAKNAGMIDVKGRLEKKEAA